MIIIQLLLIMSMMSFLSVSFETEKRSFAEPLNTAVLTTKFVARDNHDITFVSHDSDDGAWQFHSNDQIDNFEDVAMVVSLKEIIAIDSSVLEIAELPLGFEATRKDRKSKWEISKSE